MRGMPASGWLGWRGEHWQDCRGVASPGASWLAWPGRLLACDAGCVKVSNARRAWLAEVRRGCAGIGGVGIGLAGGAWTGNEVVGRLGVAKCGADGCGPAGGTRRGTSRTVG
jgi:hypothetical protein